MIRLSLTRMPLGGLPDATRSAGGVFTSKSHKHTKRFRLDEFSGGGVSIEIGYVDIERANNYWEPLGDWMYYHD
jgi:hypothetical protein